MINMFGIEGINDKVVNVNEPVQYLSFADLDKVVGFKSCKETNNKEEFLRIIYKNGADITKPFFIEKVNHRMRTSNDAVDGLRVVFTERTDKSWKMSGACSTEAYLFTEDGDLRSELNSLDPSKRNHRHVADEDIDWDADDGDFEDWSREDDSVTYNTGNEGDCC
jgi:hypothetical protein